MSETPVENGPAVKVTIEKNQLILTVSLTNPQNDMAMAKITCYGALKLAEEQASIYFMQKQMQERQNKLIRPGAGKPFTPGVV